ncbi:MAG: hypothetical protein GY950_26115 [bacterium]|nr:hypothetical protein [bacterium]
MRKTRFAGKALIICLFLIATLTLNAVPAPQEKIKPLLDAPIQSKPGNNSSFKGFPTTLTVEWKPVTGADSYDVEIDCLGCAKPGKWNSETGKIWKLGPEVRNTKYTFIFAGSYKGRWRVRASKNIFKKGAWSSWRHFEFDTTGSKKNAAEACGIVLESLSKTNVSEGDTFTLHGVWGTKGPQIVCLKNKDKIIELPIRIWSEHIVKVKIPAGLAPGKYKVGAYCRNPKMGRTDSTAWLDFEIIKK